jgi:hypothetical protein
MANTPSTLDRTPCHTPPTPGRTPLQAPSAPFSRRPGGLLWVNRGRLPSRASALVVVIASVALVGPLPTAGQQTTIRRPIGEVRVERFPVDFRARGTASVTESSDLSTLPYLSGPARAGEYVGVVGSRAAWLGLETGEGEAWVHPLKVAREIGLAFKIPDYAEAIPGARLARTVEARPGLVTLTYSHGAFVVREHILAPRDRPGLLLLLEVDTEVDLEIRVEFQPVLQYAWPGGLGGQYLFWDQENRAFVLSESLRTRNAVIGSSWATEGSAHPAHRLADAPAVFVIPVDPVRARDELIPIAVAGGISPRDEVLELYRGLMEGAASLAHEIHDWARELREDHLRVSGGWPPAGQALEWAKVNLAEQRVCNPDLGCGLVAGWGASGTSLRPGFGWFFGGDAAINTLAMDATGQWDAVAEALRFLARYQRADGKMPHEISQAARRIPWFEEYPYAYYHADTTPFWMLALWHYWRASGDQELVQELWGAFRTAYRWCLSVETDGDGIIENTTGGLGAIEVGGLGEGIHQDIYLAAVWTEALRGTAEMAGAMGDAEMASQARNLLDRARTTLNEGYWRANEGHHAFGILRGGGTNNNLTAWPGTALSFGLMGEEEAEGTLRHLARDAISSSWGARLLSTESALFDPLHYNNGMVWPFMTGFVSWAQYRYRRPWAGYPLLQALWRLNEDWALGRHPENLSGAFYQTVDATVPHQFFASSMLVTPFVRGLLGWDPDAPAGRAVLAPQLPPDWEALDVENLRVGASSLTYRYRREVGLVEVELALHGPPLELTYIQALPLGARNVSMEGGPDHASVEIREGRHDLEYEVTFPLMEEHPVHFGFRWEGGLSVFTPPAVPRPGDRSGGIRILDFVRQGEAWVLTVEGDGGRDGVVHLRGETVVTADGEVLGPTPESETFAYRVAFPDTAPRVQRILRLRPRNDP